MKDLFEREEDVLRRADQFLTSLEKDDALAQQIQKEFEFLMGEYGQVLRQLRWVTRIADLTATGLNTDKSVLLNKVNVDALTEIYNRRFLMMNLEHYLEELADNEKFITVMMLDVDYFKNFNDTYGHPVGDICLKKIANALHNSLTGADDFVVRYGGEEFIAVLPAADKAVGMRVAQKILDNIIALQIPHEKSKVADCVTLSIGVVSDMPKAGIKMQQYIDRADAALYLSKKNGRNRITYLSLEGDKND